MAALQDSENKFFETYVQKNLALNDLKQAFYDQMVDTSNLESAATYAEEAKASAELAQAAWAASTAPAEQLASIDTTFFPSTTLVTAIQFDTSTDHEGGAWRKRCADKSWYTETIYGNQIGVGYYANEAAARAVSGVATNDYYYDTTAGLFKALNAGSGTTTIYRGGRREFPQNGIVTVEAARVVIWDCDYGAPRMWMVGRAGVSGRSMFGYANTFTSAAYKSGVLVISATTASHLGLIKVNFIEDAAYGYNQTTSYGGKCNNSIANRNSETNAYNWGTGNSLALVSQACNAVAITTLENAPLDEYGMPADTLAVGTDGGVTVLGWDGVQDNVAWDIVVTSYTYVNEVGFGLDGRVVFSARESAGATGRLFSGPLPTADVSFGYTTMPAGYSSLAATGDSDQNLASFPTGTGGSYLKVNPVAGNYKVRGFNSSGPGLEIFRENPTTPTKGMGAKITHTYNTGWLTGDIRRAWLADTTAETLTADTPLSDDFSGYADTAAMLAAGWTGIVNGTPTLVSGKLRVTLSSNQYGMAYRAFTTVVGKTYNATVEYATDGITNSAFVYVGSSVGSSNLAAVGIAAIGTTTVTFVAAGTTTYIQVGGGSTALSGEYTEWDNITVKLAEPDRCVKNKALTVVGSLTKAAVASGANLVAYSGFSAANYLEEAYSSDLDFGTGAHGRVFWLKEAANSAEETIFQRDSASTAQSIYARVNAAGTITFGCDDNTTDRAATSTVTVDDGLWHLYWCRYDGAGGVYIYRDGSSTPIASATGTALLTLNNASAYVRVGVNSAAANPLTNGSLAMKRVSATDMTMQQWAEIYEQEKKLFEAGAQCTLAGTSSAVLAVDHDEITDVTSVLTSYGRSDFKGLVRVASEATAVGTPKAVSALGGSILQVGSTGVDYYAPAKNLREELPTDLGDKPRQLFDFDLSSATTCTLPQGWKPTGAVWSAGAKKRQGAAKDFTTSYDGFLWSVVMTSSTTAWVQVEGEQQ